MRINSGTVGFQWNQWDGAAELAMAPVTVWEGRIDLTDMRLFRGLTAQATTAKFNQMSAIVTYPHIIKPEDDSARLEKHPRTRVSMIVVDHKANGWSAEDIVKQYPYLSLSEVYSALAYYYDHVEEIDAELNSERTEIERRRQTSPMTPVQKRLSGLKARGGLDATDAG